MATPHVRHSLFWNGDLEALRRLYEELRPEIDPILELRFGAEITVRHDSLEEILELPDGALPTLAGSRYVLLELEPHPVGPEPGEVVHELLVQHVVPVLAHPERIPWLIRTPELLRSLVAQGALLQLTATSVTGGFGRRLRKTCHDLIAEGLVHFVASDAHDTGGRPPGLSAARDEISGAHGEDVAARLTEHNPRAVLDDQPLPDGKT